MPKWFTEAVDSFFGLDTGTGIAQGIANLESGWHSLIDDDGFFARPKDHWNKWAKEIGMGGDDDDEGENTQRTVTDITTPVTPTEELDPGLTQTVAPTFVDASASGKRATARSRMATLGYDTRTSKGRDTEEIEKKRYGTALSRMA